MSILLLGRSGYIGSAFAAEMTRRGIRHHAVSRSDVNYTNFRSLCALLASGAYTTVINCAAFVTTPSVELCNDHKDETLLGNTVFVQTLVNACDLTKTNLLHISTGCIYQGDNNGKGWAEDDPPQISFENGDSFYIGSKVLAEQIALRGDRVWICRIRIPFDHIDHPKNILTKYLNFPKIFSAPNSMSHRQDFVAASLRMIEWRVPFGLYNITNWGSITAREVCESMVRILKLDRTFEFWDSEEFLTKVAKTVKSNCVLNISKIERTGIHMRPIKEAVTDSLTKWITNVPTNQPMPGVPG